MKTKTTKQNNKIGAVGVVHFATNVTNGAKKAIKVIPRGDCSDLSRLDTEIRIMMMLHHPNIVELEEVLESETNVFFVMEVYSDFILRFLSSFFSLDGFLFIFFSFLALWRRKFS